MVDRHTQSHPEGRPYNWLVNQIVEEHLAPRLSRYAHGILVDIGCGVKPYVHLTRGLVTKHVGVDHLGSSRHDVTTIDVTATAYETTLPDESADTVLCTAVLEHLERPENALREMYRVLKSGGCALLTVPLFWHLHEEPRDFYRFTKHGLAYLLQRVGFEVVEIVPMSGFVVTFSQEMCYFVERFRRRFNTHLISGIQWLLQRVAWQLRSWDQSHEYTWMYVVVARRP